MYIFRLQIFFTDVVSIKKTLFCVALKKIQYLALKPISTSLQKDNEQEIVNHKTTLKLVH